MKAQKRKKLLRKFYDGTGVEEIVAERDAAKKNSDAKQQLKIQRNRNLIVPKKQIIKSNCKKMQKSVEADQIKKSQETAANCHLLRKTKTSTRESKESSRK